MPQNPQNNLIEEAMDSLEGLFDRCYDYEKLRKILLTLQKETIEAVMPEEKMESDYDDEDKRARRDVRPWNECRQDIISKASDIGVILEK